MDLIDAGHNVVVIDKKINDKLREWLPEENLIEDDFINSVLYDLPSFDAVIHLAAVSDYSVSGIEADGKSEEYPLKSKLSSDIS